MTSKRNTSSLILLALVTTFAASTISCVTMTASDWGFSAIDHMATPVDPPLTCPVNLPIDQGAKKRAACDFSIGAHAWQSLGVQPNVSANIPIRHIIVMMKENRSFDHILGKLHDQGQPQAEGVESIPPSMVNLDLEGKPVPPFHPNTTCIGYDPTHQAASMISSINGGAMDGFVNNAATSTGTDGHFVMGVYENTDLPFYYWIANTFALSDRHFAPMASGTYGVRNFFLFGTNAGVVDTGILYPDPNTMSIFRLLMNAGFTWGAYTDDAPFSGALGWTAGEPGMHSMQELFDALDNGTLPNVVFVDGVGQVSDDHPPSDLQVGEAWSKQLYDHAVASPQWPRMAIVWTYDEGGAFADHVVPPKGCLALPSDSPFTDLGPRVPLVMISPWAKRHYVSHVVHDHTAITRLIETIFDLPAMTARDANSDALLDMFDFSCGRDMTPPAGAPAAGTGGRK